MRFFRRKKKQPDKPAEQLKSQEKHQDVTEKPEAKNEKADNNRVVSTARYHVSQNKNETSEHYKEWRIRKEGSNKTIKYFKTQKQAIDYAEELAQNQGSSIVIHKVDGSLRKQDYSKK
jgi:uncharacterized protein YdaT